MAPLPIHWPACPTHAIKQPHTRLHVRADLLAMTESPNNRRFEKKKTPKRPAIHLHAFQDVRVFAAALDADADPPVILFNSRLENDLREDS